MNLEPAVVSSIRENKRRVQLHRARAIIPLAAIIAVTVFFILWTRSAFTSSPTIPGLDMDYAPKTQMIVVFVGRLVPMFGMMVATVYRLLTPARRQFKDLTTRSAHFDQSRLEAFQSDLASVGIGMGVRVPEVVVVAVPTPTAFAFKERGVNRIAVTPALLDAGLSQAEREAVMAHELAHVVDGNALVEPSVLRGVYGIFFIAAPLLVMLTGIFGGLSLPGMMIAMFVPWVLLMLGWPLALWLLVRPYTIQTTKDLDHYSDVLADSIAVKVTGNPDAMKSSITRLRDMIEAAPQMPSESIAFGHMFIGPLKEWPLVASELLPTTGTVMMRQKSYQMPNGPAPGWLGFLSGKAPAGREGYASNLDYKNAQVARELMGPVVQLHKELIAERLINLDYIEQNRWQLFQVSHGRITTRPSGWE